jgi:hypothetical protein
VFEEGAYQSNGAEMAELRAWVLAQLLWNPHQDDRALIREFLEGYYGSAAARPINRYLALMQEASGGYYLACYTHPQAPYLSFKVLAAAEQCWANAEHAAANDPEKLARVQVGHLAVRFAFLRDWAELRQQCAQQQAAWPLPASPEGVAEQFEAVGQEIPGNHGLQGLVLSEGGLTADKFLAQFKRP